MKRFVSIVSRDWGGLLALALFVAMLIFETDKALVLLFLLVVGGVPMWLYETPPRWLLRSPLGRWLRR